MIGSLFIVSQVHGFFASWVHSVSCAWNLPCHFVGISATIRSFVDAPHNFNTSLLFHIESNPVVFLISHSHVFFLNFILNFCPGAGRAVSGKKEAVYGTTVLFLSSGGGRELLGLRRLVRRPPRLCRTMEMARSL